MRAHASSASRLARVHPISSSSVPELTTSLEMPELTTFYTYDNRNGTASRIKHPPTVHLARGYEEHLPFLRAGRAVIVISDWQVEPATQRHFWEQALRTLRDELGAETVARAVVLVAGDMASAGDELRGVKSDAVPELEWLRDSFPEGDVHIVYGNHDLCADEHLAWRNAASQLPCMLPHGAALAVPLASRAAAPHHAAPSAAAVVATGTDAPEATSAAVTEATAQHDETQQDDDDAMQPPKVPTAEQLAGLSKRDRAALWVSCSFERRPQPTKQERQQRQHKAQRPEEASLLERLRALHAASAALLRSREAVVAAAAAPSSTARASVAAAADATPTLVLGAVHGIPASHTQGLRKVERDAYFGAVDAACALPIDVLVTHANPKLPGQDEVRGDDAPRLHEAFLRSSAALHVHGHMHTESVVAVVAPGKVVANSDGRVIAFAPACSKNPKKG